MKRDFTRKELQDYIKQMPTNDLKDYKQGLITSASNDEYKADDLQIISKELKRRKHTKK